LVAAADSLDAEGCEATGLLSVLAVGSRDELAADADMLLLPGQEITHRSLIEACAHTGRPLLLGTWGSSLKEVTRAVGWHQLAFRSGVHEAAGRGRVQIEHGGKLILLHGPGGPLRAMARMREQSLTPVGYAIGAEGTRLAPLAVAAGADVILHNGTGFAAMAESVRQAEALLGAPQKAPDADESEAAGRLRRALVAAHDLPAGHKLQARDLLAIAPAPVKGGFAPYELESVLGRELQRGLKAGSPVLAQDLSGAAPEPPSWFSPRPPRKPAKR
jgi:sialic acid synthase SpsE